MKVKEKVVRFVDNNSSEILNSSNLGFAIYIYYLICFLVAIFLELFFKNVREDMKTTILDGCILIVMSILYFRQKNKYVVEEHWAKRKMNWKKFLCICLLSRLTGWIGSLIVTGIIRLGGIESSTFYGTVDSLGTSINMILTVVILGPISEEIIFRGFGLSLFKKRDNKLEAIIFTSVIFGLMHGNWYQAVVSILVGFVYAYAAIEFGILYAIFLHMFHNAWVYLTYFLKPFVSLSYVGLVIFIMFILNRKRVTQQIKFALKSERKYSIQKQLAYFSNPILLMFSIAWIWKIIKSF